MAFDVYSLNNNYKSYSGIDANVLSEELIENSFSNSIYEGSLEHEDLLVHFYLLFINGYEAFIHDKEQKSYIKQVIGCDYGEIKPRAKKIYAFYKENNQYILKIKYIWGSQYDISPITSIYPSHEDVFNKTNLIFETIFDFEKDEVIKSSSEYIQENSDYLYSITQMHNYVFEYKDGMYKLVDFYRS